MCVPVTQSAAHTLLHISLTVSSKTLLLNILVNNTFQTETLFDFLSMKIMFVFLGPFVFVLVHGTETMIHPQDAVQKRSYKGLRRANRAKLSGKCPESIFNTHTVHRVERFK